MSDEKLKLKIEKSPTKKYNRKSIIGNAAREKKVSFIGNEKSHSFNYIKLYSIQDSITDKSKLKSAVDLKKTEDIDEVIRPILKNKEASPTKVIKRLKTQGALRKVKNVNFKKEMVEYKEIESLSKMINDRRKKERGEEKVQTNCTSCSCIVF